MSDLDQTQSRSPLESERGSTTVQSGVVTKIAGVAANEVEGIRMGGSASRALGDYFSGGSSSSRDLTRGISVDVGRVEAAIEVTMEVEYGRSILQLTERLRDRVTERVQNLTGLRIARFNVTINDVIFPEGDEGGAASPRRKDDTTQSLPSEEIHTGSASRTGDREGGSTDVAAARSEAVTQAGGRFSEETIRRSDQEDQTTEISPEEESQESRRERRRRRREGR